MKFETILKKEKVIKIKKLVERLEQRKKEIIIINNKILEAVIREIIVIKK